MIIVVYFKGGGGRGKEGICWKVDTASPFFFLFTPSLSLFLWLISKQDPASVHSAAKFKIVCLFLFFFFFGISKGEKTTRLKKKGNNNGEPLGVL